MAPQPQQPSAAVQSSFVPQTGASSELGSLVPPPAQRKAVPARGLPPSRVEVNRQRGAIGNAWEKYQRTFIRTGSFMPIFHALGGLTILQFAVWGVRGMPDEVRGLYEGNTGIRTGRPRTPDTAPNAEK